MQFQNLEFHNIADIREAGWPPNTFQLQRVPEEVRLKLNEGAQGRSLCTANAEIRFVCDGPFKVHLRTPNGENRIRIAFGSFLWRDYPTSDCVLEVERPENMANVDLNLIRENPFSSKVVRILLPNDEVEFIKLTANGLRPPTPEEVPGKRLLCCGTSITQGGCATSPHLSYASLAARELGFDLINLGMSGSFHAEPELADYVASRQDWDVATIELSVNMVPCFQEDEFRKRAKYFINAIAAAHPEKPVHCITLYPYFNDLCHQISKEDSIKTQNFRQILRDEVASSDHKNLHLIEGSDILQDPSGLTADMIHPSDFGMMQMARNLAARLHT